MTQKTKAMKKGALRALWVLFRKEVIAKKAPHEQVKEMKLGFYAGAQALLNIACEIGKEEYSEEQGRQVLQNLDNEIQQLMKTFAKKVKSAGK